MKEKYRELLTRLETEALEEGRGASVDDCLRLAAGADPQSNEPSEADELLNAIADAAHRVRLRWQGEGIDTCSIVNARSGRCTENCKWCAQAASHHTGCEEYLFVGEEPWLQAVDTSEAHGVGRISMVCSGRKVGKADVERFCAMYRVAAERGKIGFCASMGLLGRDELQALYDAGVRRYHCNIETSAAFFPTLCTSHTREDKLATIRAAQEVGMEVCSGGIIGMGETLRDRLEMARESRQAGACSLPLNLLSPIKGTPLEDTPLISEREVVLSAALMRLVAPRLTMRFAGGRKRLSEAATRRLLTGGMNGALVGDMLTTVGNDMDKDFALFHSLKPYEAKNEEG